MNTKALVRKCRDRCANERGPPQRAIRALYTDTCRRSRRHVRFKASIRIRRSFFLSLHSYISLSLPIFLTPEYVCVFASARGSESRESMSRATRIEVFVYWRFGSALLTIVCPASYALPRRRRPGQPAAQDSRRAPDRAAEAGRPVRKGSAARARCRQLCQKALPSPLVFAFSSFPWFPPEKTLYGTRSYDISRLF